MTLISSHPNILLSCNHYQQDETFRRDRMANLQRKLTFNLFWHSSKLTFNWNEIPSWQYTRSADKLRQTASNHVTLPLNASSRVKHTRKFYTSNYVSNLSIMRQDSLDNQPTVPGQVAQCLAPGHNKTGTNFPRAEFFYLPHYTVVNVQTLRQVPHEFRQLLEIELNFTIK